MKEKEKRTIEELLLIKNIIKYIVPGNSKSLKKKHKERSRLEEKILKDSFSLDIKKGKDKGEIKQDYSFVIKYEENESEEKLMIEAEDDKEKYSFEIKREKPVPDKLSYQLNIIYENNKEEEKLEIKYNLRDYPTEREKALQDFTNQLDKTLHIFPESVMGGVLGFTYLGENFMGRRADLTGDKALMVDVHEAIHTDNEYETRCLTQWMLSREKSKYIR